jgi:YVTN family beta-propeller protein
VSAAKFWNKFFPGENHHKHAAEGEPYRAQEFTGPLDDDNNGDWTEWVCGTNAAMSGRIQGWDLPDRDVAIIDTATLGITYAQRLMNICMAMSVNPVSGEIAVVGTEAVNEQRFEPIINGIFVRVNLALVDLVTRTSRIRDLNPHLNYSKRTLPEAQRALSLGDPRGIEWSSDGARAYITGMGSRNLIVVNSNGFREQTVEVGEGPTGLALDEPRSRLYVWNRFSSSISVVDTSADIVLTNVPVFDPTPEIVRKGRRHLYDTRKTSGLGIASCASCHVDARGDRLGSRQSDGKPGDECEQCFPSDERPDGHADIAGHHHADELQRLRAGAAGDALAWRSQGHRGL